MKVSIDKFSSQTKFNSDAIALFQNEDDLKNKKSILHELDKKFG